MARVVLKDVSKVFPEGVHAVRHLDLEVRDQELMVLVGPSGCGKSTTLRMIAGLEAITEGTVTIGERIVNGVTPKDRDIAMVFQNYALYPHMSVYRNMAFGLELRYGGGWLARIWRRLARPRQATELAEQRRGIKPRVRQAAALLGIEHLLGRMPRQLSGGERQRVALGRAIVRRPAAFLFDEPLSNLDAKLRVDMRRELKQLHRRLQATMIYVTHDQVEALTLGDRIAVMNQGVVQQVGAPLELYDFPRNRFVAGFVGTPPMNFVAGRVQRGNGRPRFQAVGIAAELSEKAAASMQQFNHGQAVVMGIRPQDVIIDGRDESGLEGEHNTNWGRISMVEALGDSSVVHVQTGAGDSTVEESKNTVVCKTEARTTLHTEDRVSLCFQPDRAHFFDPETGDNLIYTPS